MNDIRQVYDETGALHVLSKLIGSGGQGDVWLAEGGRRIVKLLKNHSSADARAMRNQFAFVRRLDLADLHVAKPIAVLKQPHVGYVAEFLAEMVPIKTLIEAPKSNLLRWYLDTGGLRRRLRLLAHAGEALHGLHARGVIYADVSHNNVFVSEPTNATEAWLIDLDNLSHESDHRHAIYTPSYGAPELVARTAGCTSLSDAWAFAVLVWQTLTLTHPFLGDYVNDGEPELEEAAFAGRLPWVRHSTNEQNRCSTGLPPECVLAKNLEELASRTFEKGRDDRIARPGVSDWVDRLHAAADQTVACPNCFSTYFVTEQACSWCEEPMPGIVPIRFSYWHPDKGLVNGPKRLRQLPLTQEGLVLNSRVTAGHSGLAGRIPQVCLSLLNRGVSVRALNGRKAWASPVGKGCGKSFEVLERERILPTTGWMLFFDEPGKPQRVAVIGGSQ